MIAECLKRVDAQIEAKHLLTHPFYRAWSQGSLSLECLKEYAKEYYHHVRAFPTYLSALHSRIEDPSTRRAILQNLIEEEAGEPNHPALWRSFAHALGASDEEIDAHAPSAEITALIASFREICGKKSVASAIAALYAYESQIPEISISKIAGLKKHYKMKDPASWRYFSVHIEADKEHAKVERELLEKHISQGDVQEMERSVDRILEGLWSFLTSLQMRYGVHCS